MHVEFVEEADEFWSPLDITNAIKNLSEVDICRLHSIAKQYSYHCSMDVDEILNEAIFRALSGKRKYPINVSLIAFISQTMRSIAFNERRKNEKHESIDDSTTSLQDKSVSPEEKATAYQELNAILELFKDDEDITSYLMGLYDGLTPDEICEIWGWDRTKYGSVQKRLRRSLNKHYPNGREND
jgi:RNA polymerase sigma factor (sigma-70 family)